MKKQFEQNGMTFVISVEMVPTKLDVETSEDHLWVTCNNSTGDFSIQNLVPMHDVESKVISMEYRARSHARRLENQLSEFEDIQQLLSECGFVYEDEAQLKSQRQGIIRDYALQMDAIDTKKFPGAEGVFESNRLIAELEGKLFPNENISATSR